MKVIVIPRVRSTSDIFHFHQKQVVLFINSSRTYVVFPFNTTSSKNTYMLFTGWEVCIGKNCDRGLNMLTEASGLYGNLRKFSENFGNGSKVIFRCFHDFLNFRKIFGNLRKCSEIFGKLRKRLKSNFQMFS